LLLAQARQPIVVRSTKRRLAMADEMNGAHGTRGSCIETRLYAA
jgi:threonine dehydrogenase-like Zn-dependent dehydrogenase